MLLQELEQLNVAINNITRVQNLQKCESLRKLDLTANFIDKAAVPTLCSLQHNQGLRELHLLGNSCTSWHSYRAYVVGSLPQLHSLVCALDIPVAPTLKRGVSPFEFGQALVWQGLESASQALQCKRVLAAAQKLALKSNSTQRKLGSHRQKFSQAEFTWPDICMLEQQAEACGSASIAPGTKRMAGSWLLQAS